MYTCRAHLSNFLWFIVLLSARQSVGNRASTTLKPHRQSSYPIKPKNSAGSRRLGHRGFTLFIYCIVFLLKFLRYFSCKVEVQTITSLLLAQLTSIFKFRTLPSEPVRPTFESMTNTSLVFGPRIFQKATITA